VGDGRRIMDLSSTRTQPVIRSASILVVDDEPDIRDMLTILLSEHGFSVKTATNFYSALYILEQDKNISYMLLDYNMPGMSTQQFVNRARVLNAEIKIVLMTAAERVAEKARQLGLEHYIGKPFEYDKLRSLIAEPATPV